MNKNQIEVAFSLVVGSEKAQVENLKTNEVFFGPFCVRFIGGHGMHIVRDLGPAHIKVIRETCEGRCMLNLNEDGTPEILNGKKVLSINMIFNKLQY